MEYIAEIRAELSGYPGTDKLIFKQGDQNMRYVIVTLLKNGVPVSVSSDVTPRIHMNKPDGKQVITDDNVEMLEDGTLKVRITPQMATAAGCGSLDIGLYKQGALLSTAVINVLVYPQAISMVKVASSDEYQSLIDALGQIAPAIDAEKERVKDEAIRQQQEILRQEALELCKEWTGYAETWGKYAKGQGSYAEQWGKYAEEHATKIVSDFTAIKETIESTASGELLLEIKALLEDLYRTASDIDIDNIISGEYTDENDEGSIFEAGSNQDIDEILGGTYVESQEEDTADDAEIQAIIDSLFK